MTPIAYVAIIITALVGFFIALKVNRKKKEPAPMVCPLNFKCDTVVRSEFSTFFRIPVEVLGMLYYGGMAFSYGFIALELIIPSPFFIFLLLALSTGAFLFSLYLTFVQAFLLRQWCSWCLISAGLSTIIFAVAVLSAGGALVDLLAAQRALLTTAELLGLAIGLGGATISDILFIKFLKDNRISEDEADVLRTLRHFVWFGLALLITTGIGLFLAGTSAAIGAPLFVFELGVIAIIIINGALLNLLVTPKLVSISFGERHDHKEGELRILRKSAFIFGTVSVLSWYTLFVTKIYPGIPPAFEILLLGYGALLLLGIAGSQVAESIMAQRARGC